MRKKIVQCALMVALVLALGPGFARATTVLTFDTLPGDESAVPNGYGGLDWNNFYCIDAGAYSYSIHSGGVPGAVSAPNVAYNGDGDPASVTSATPFEFGGGYFTAVWNDNLNLTVDGYLGGVLEDSQTVGLSATAPTFEAFDYADVDEVTFDSFGGTPHPGYSSTGEQFAMDDFEIGPAVAVSAVPEPATMTLLGLGLAGLIGRRMRRRSGR